MSEFLSQFQANRESFRGLISDEVIALRNRGTEWQFGEDTLSFARRYFQQSSELAPRIEIGLVNDSSMNATWYRVNESNDSYAIAVNRGLVEAIRLIATDVFGQGAENEKEIAFGARDLDVGRRVADRMAAYLEIGYPFGQFEQPTARRAPFVDALVEDALQFIVLHEFAHILLGHNRGDVHLLRNRMVDLQIATFSIGQEHQADMLAARLHGAMRRESAKKYQGMEFAGPTLFFGLLGVFERYTRYQAAFDTPHAHPHAYERLYRLRVYYSSGDGHMYWALPRDAGVQLARLDLEPNPEAVRFSDAVAKSLLSALMQAEEIGVLRSPMNDLFNRLAAEELNVSKRNECWGEICRWLYLGSPQKVLQHLVEARENARIDLQRSSQAEDEVFLRRCIELIDDLTGRIKNLNDYSVMQAAKKTGLIDAH